jgi:hypothetical protein
LLNLAASMVSTDSLEPPEAKWLRHHVPGEIGKILQAVAPFVVYDPFQPLALTEMTEIP